MFANCWQVCSVTCHGLMFNKVQNIKSATQILSPVVVLSGALHVSGLRPQSPEHSERPWPQALVWEVVSTGCSSRVAHFTLPSSVEGVSRHLSCGSWFQSWLLEDEQQLAIYSFTLVCQYSFFFLSPSPQSNVFLPWSLTWFMALSKKWNWSGAPVLLEQNCLLLADSLGF